MSKQIITVIIEDGLVQDILDIPPDIEVHVKDYDCDEECCEENPGVQEDDDGEHWLSVYGSGFEES